MNARAVLMMAAFSLPLLAACEPVEYEPKTGIVTDLEYEEAESWTEHECGYTTGYDGRYRYSCWTDSGVDPECYLVEFEDSGGRLWEDCTSEAIWTGLVIGDVYTED